MGPISSREQEGGKSVVVVCRVLQLPKRIGGGGSSPPGVPGGRKPALVWFRNDLRLHDHEPLAAACAASTSVLPVYVFDPREYGKVGVDGGIAAACKHTSLSRHGCVPCLVAVAMDFLPA